MSEESARLRIPYLAASQAQKHVTHNEALTLLDTLCQASVIDKDLTTPPISPAEGDCYIVAATGTGAWTGWDNRIVRYIDGEWRSYLPGAGDGAGWLVYVQDEAALYVFDGSAWHIFARAGDRELLTANRTYYVRTDGSDSNDGLSDSSGGAFLTVQKAVDAALALDLGGFDVTIQVADGTYTGTVRMETPQVGDGDITIQGNNGTPGNVLLTATSPVNNEGTITARNKARLFVKDLEIRATTTGGCLCADKGASIYWQNINFGSCAGQQIRVQDGGSAECLGNYAITGGGQAHWAGAAGVIRCQSKTITITGTPAFASFVTSGNASLFIIGGNTYSGSATGARFNLSGNAVISGDASATALPGNTAGTLATGARYSGFNSPEDAAAWGIATVSGGVPTLAASFNITSITDTATGELTVTIATDFASANYAWLASVELPGTTYEEANVRRVNIRNGTRAAGSIVLDCYDDTEDTHLLADPASWHFAGFGAQY